MYDGREHETFETCVVFTFPPLSADTGGHAATRPPSTTSVLPATLGLDPAISLLFRLAWMKLTNRTLTGQASQSSPTTCFWPTSTCAFVWNGVGVGSAPFFTQTSQISSHPPLPKLLWVLWMAGGGCPQSVLRSAWIVAS